MKYSCLKNVTSETHPPPRRQFDVFRENIDLWVAPKVLGFEKGRSPINSLNTTKQFTHHPPGNYMFKVDNVNTRKDAKYVQS